MSAARRLLPLLFWLACESNAPAPSAAPPAQPVGPEPAAAGPTLALSVSPTAQGAAVDVVFRRRDGAEGPRMAEIWLAVPTNARLEATRPGEAATAAGKTVTTQVEDDGVRLVIYATGNLERVDSGVLARLEFTRTGAGPLTFGLQPRLPVFAPPEANEGVLLQDPQTLGEGAP